MALAPAMQLQGLAQKRVSPLLVLRERQLWQQALAHRERMPELRLAQSLRQLWLLVSRHQRASQQRPSA